MILTCPECQTQYNLEPGQLGAGGRKVRCVSCHHVWFQPPEQTEQQEQAEQAAPAESESVPPPQAEPEQAPPTESSAEPDKPSEKIQAALDALLDKDDAVFESLLTGITEAEKAIGALPGEEKVVAPRPMAPSPPPVITHNPLGVNARVFGALAFALCVFVTLGFVMLAQSPILRHWPQMALLYRTLGLHVEAPGEGLQLNGIVAERHMDPADKSLVVKGEMSNISGHEVAYPPLAVTLKGADGAVIKEWTLKAAASSLSAGENVPVMLQLPDAPQDGAIVEVHVKD